MPMELKKLAGCYAQSQTDDGQELRCSLRRNHKTDHYDGARNMDWRTEHNAIWALVAA
jgi:hypothetical protein